MKNLFLFLLAVNAINLEWNILWNTDTPYEVAVDLARLDIPSDASLAVYADGEMLKTYRLVDTNVTKTIFRFKVPDGTRELQLKEGESTLIPSHEVDNIFEGSSWKGDANVRITPGDDALLLESTKWKNGTVVCRADVPEHMRGRDVMFELNAEGMAQMPWSSVVYMEQYDSAGHLLPEYVYDARWTTLIRPINGFTPFREKGHIHPKAASVKMIITLRPDAPKYDLYGIRVDDPSPAMPRLKISNLALRPVAFIPFPAMRASHWSEGVSSREGDMALSLDKDRCFWVATRSSASWARGEQVRSEDQIFFPAGAGTVEMWVKPQLNQKSSERVYFFDAANHMSIAAQPRVNRLTRGSMAAVSYVPSTGMIRMELKDVENNGFTKEKKAAVLSGEWNHIALCWTPDAKGSLYLNGTKIMEIPIKGFKGLDLAKSSCPNDDQVMAVYLGAHFRHARVFTEVKRQADGLHFMEGDVDLLRISSGERYSGDFVPQRSFECDPSTRALFDFNKNLDGVSGGGIGYISGSIRATENMLEHKVGDCQYYPEKLLAENDPAVVLHPRVKELPLEDDFAAGFIEHSLSFDLGRGESKVVTVPENTVVDYVQIENTGKTVLKYPALLANDDIDARSFGDIRESLDDPSMSARDKAYRIFNFLLEKSDYFANHNVAFDYGTDVAKNTEYAALKMLNSYCGFECGPLNNLCMSLFATCADCPTSMIYGNGHSYEEVYYGGQNHVFDLSPQTFFPSMDNENAAGLGETEVQPGSHFRTGASCEHFTRHGTRSLNPTYIKYAEKFAISLNPGESLRFCTGNDGTMNDLQVKAFAAHAEGGIDCREATHADETDKGVWRIDRFFPEFSNAFLIFDGVPSADNPAFTDISAKSFCYNVYSCYPIVEAEYEAILTNGKKAKLEISTDLGESFRAFSSPATYAVRARHGYLIRVNAPISKVKSFRAVTKLQTNRRMITGLLTDGDNTVRLKAESGEGARISYQYRTKAQPIIFEGAVQWGAIKGFEQSLVVLDPSKGPLSLSVKGIGPDAKVEAEGDIQAKLSSSSLVLSSKNKTAHLASVVVEDGGRKKILNVIVCPSAQLQQFEATLSNKGDKCKVDLGHVSEGKYMLLSLCRFPVDSKQPHQRSVSVSMGESIMVPAASPINHRFDYLKDIIGPDGGRGVWRWDTPVEGKKAPMSALIPIIVNNADSLEYSFDGTDGPVELKAVVIIPFPEREFLCDLAKLMFGRNFRPYSVHPYSE